MTDKLHILAIGDCNTGGVSGSLSVNIPTALCRRLNESGIKTELTNFGATMSTSREGIVRAGEAPANADVLLLNFGLVDAWMTALPGWYISYFPDSAVKRVFRKILKSLKKRLRHPFFRKHLPFGWVVDVEEYKRNIQKTVDIVRAKSPHAKIIIWGSAPTRLNAERSGWLENYDAALKSIADKNGYLYLDTRQLLEPHATEIIFQDHVHLSSDGYEIVAEAMKSLITK